MDNLPPTLLQPTENESKKSFLYGALANVLISTSALLLGCNSTKDEGYQQQTPISHEKVKGENDGSNRRIGLEKFVKELPKDSRVLIGYDRWDYTPRPGEHDKLISPTREVLEIELLDADKSKKLERASSIRRIINLSESLKREGIDCYITSISRDNIIGGYFTLDYRATHIVSTGTELTKDQANKLSEAHRYAGVNNPLTPTQKTPIVVEAYNYLNLKGLEKLTER